MIPGRTPALIPVSLLALFAASSPSAEKIELASRDARQLLRDHNYAAAAQLADKVYGQAVSELKRRPLDQETKLPLALGAAIEVKAAAMNAQGRRAEAVSYLNSELKKYYATSVRARIQKNINLLSLEGKPAPALNMTALLGPKPPERAGKPVLLFFWAHWCGDCRGDAPVVTRLQRQFPGLVIIGPTQHYGYVEGGEEATAAQETAYIEQVRRSYFSTFAVPVNEENFKNFGGSTTPTFVLIDKQGVVRMYHPGAMTYGDLAAKIQPLI